MNFGIAYGFQTRIRPMPQQLVNASIYSYFKLVLWAKAVCLIV